MIRHLLMGGLLLLGLTADALSQLNVPVDFCWSERGVFTEWHASSVGSTKADLVAIVPEGTEAEPQPLAGKIYLIGTIRTASTQVLALKRLNADGTQDLSFGDGGWMLFPPGFAVLYLKAAEFDSEHRLVISGSQGVVNGMKGFVMRLNLDGTLDPSFAGTGIYTNTFGNGQSQFMSMTLADDDSILLAGITETVGNANDQLLLARLSPTGSTSAQSVEDGSLVWNETEYYEFLVTSSTGEYLVLRTEGSLPIRISKRGPNLGELSTVDVPLPAGYLAPTSYGMIPVEDGKVVIALAAHNSPEGIRRSVIVRLNSDLTLDTSFGDDGVSDIADLVVDTYDNSYLFIRGRDGSFYLAPSSNKFFSIYRWKADGKLDETFGTDGLLKVPVSGNEIYNTNYLYDAALTAEGDIIFAGDNRHVRGAGSFSALKLWGNVAAEKQQFCDDVVALPQSGFIRPGGTARVMQFEVVVSGAVEPHSLTGVSFSTTGTTNPSDVRLARLYYGAPGSDSLAAVQVATVEEPGEIFSFDSVDVELTHGVNNFWLVYTLDPSAQLGNQYDAELNSVEVSGQSHAPSVGSPAGHMVAANILAEWDLSNFDPAISSTVTGVAHVTGVQAESLRLGPGMDLVADSAYSGAILGINWPAGSERGSTDFLEVSIEAPDGMSITYTSARYAVAFDSTWDYHVPGTMEVRASTDGFQTSVEIAKHHGNPDDIWVIEQQKVDPSLAPLGTVVGPATVGLRWYPYHDEMEYGAEQSVGAGLTNMTESDYIVGEGSNLYLFGTVNSAHANLVTISRHSPIDARVGGGTATFRVYFDKAVAGLSASNFDFANVIPGASILSVEPVGVAPSLQWDVGVTLPAQDASVRLIMDSSAGVVPAVSGLPYTDGEAYTVDTSLIPEVPAPSVTLSISTERIREDGDAVTVTAALNFAATQGTEVELSLGGTASGGDYNLPSATIFIPTGQLSGSTTITAVSDGLHEPDETIVVSIAAITGGDGAKEVTPQQVIVTIEDTDGPPSLSVEDASVVEGNAGLSPMSFTLRLSAPSALPVQVMVITHAVTASAGSDYLSTAFVITFAPGEVSKTVNVLIWGDMVEEGNETFRLELSNPFNADIATPFAVGTILDDDDITAPRVVSVERLSPSSEQTAASSVDFKVTFTESVKNVDKSDFVISGTSVSADGSTASVGRVVAEAGEEATEDDVWIVTVDGINREGTLFLAVTVVSIPPP